MAEIIMVGAGIMFAILFAFILFIFIIFLISKFKEKQYPEIKPAVSIIIPCYNEEKNIASCMDSIKNADYPKEKTEIIVVDDGSTDKTWEILAKYGNIKLFKQSHKGKSEALNLGTKIAKHDLILTIDADTIIDKNCIKEIVKPFADKEVAAASGSCKVSNKNSLIGMFQNVEYHYNNLIRSSFSKVFGNCVWFFGFLACYRKDVLKQIGLFKKDSMTEDMDISLEIKKAGYRTINAEKAIGCTTAPDTLSGLYRQRARWWTGGLQALIKNKELFTAKSSPSILFLFINHFWWTLYALISLPIIIYQVHYWLPNNGSIALFAYLFRWFTLLGPVWVIYKIPAWGISFYSFFGVLSGIITAVLAILAVNMFKDKVKFKNAFAIFFYFPYTIVLNIIITISLLKYSFLKKRYFIGE